MSAIKLLEEARDWASHDIPFHAYGDNQAACEMSARLEKIRMSIDALLKTGGWMPIETAPKDGTEFIAAFTRCGSVKQLISLNKVHGYWQCKGEPQLGFLENATHWHPIPPLPESNHE